MITATATPEGLVIRTKSAKGETAWRRNAYGSTWISHGPKGPWETTPFESLPSEILLEFMTRCLHCVVARYENLDAAKASPLDNADLFGPYEVVSQNAGLLAFMEDPHAKQTCPGHGLFLTIVMTQDEMLNADDMMAMIGAKLSAEVDRAAAGQTAQALTDKVTPHSTDQSA